MPDHNNFRLIGIGATVKLGKAGPVLVANSGQFDFRGSDGITLSPIRGGTATDPNHLVTLTQLQALNSAVAATYLTTTGSANNLTYTPNGGSAQNLGTYIANYATRSDMLGMINATVYDLSNKLDSNGSANTLTVTPTGGTSGNLVDFLGSYALRTDLLNVMNAAVIDLSNKLDVNGGTIVGNVGFYGASPVGKQTLAAALPTDGSVTNAQICAAMNALRVALIALGLAQ